MRPCHFWHGERNYLKEAVDFCRELQCGHATSGMENPEPDRIIIDYMGASMRPCHFWHGERVIRRFHDVLILHRFNAAMPLLAWRTCRGTNRPATGVRLQCGHATSGMENFAELS